MDKKAKKKKTVKVEAPKKRNRTKWAEGIDDVYVGNGVFLPQSALEIGGIDLSEQERDALADQAIKAATFNKRKAPHKPRVATNFTLGHKFSPGKPMGAKRKVTIALEQMGEDNAMIAMEQLVKWMKEGDGEATKFLLDRVYPVRKGYRQNLRYTDPIDTLDDVNKLSKHIIHMMLEGEISAEEAIEYGKKLEQRLRIIMETEKIAEITAKYEALKTMVMENVKG